MKTNQTNFRPGQLVSVKGRTGQFHYVRKNIVQDVATGKVFSVKMELVSAFQKKSLSDFIKRIFGVKK